MALGVLMNGENTVRQAGGFILQMMPGASEEVIGRLEEKLGEIVSVTAMLDEGKTPETILGDVLGEFGLEIREKIPAQFYCNCTKRRVEKALISIGKKEIQEMIQDGKPIEINCHFCGRHYVFSVEELKEIFNKAAR